MRNEIEYPITDNEVVAYLKELIDEIFDPQLIGDMRPLLLTYAINRIESTGRGAKVNVADTFPSPRGSD